jgi:hypothetical protein
MLEVDDLNNSNHYLNNTTHTHTHSSSHNHTHNGTHTQNIHTENPSSHKHTHNGHTHNGTYTHTHNVHTENLPSHKHTHNGHTHNGTYTHTHNGSTHTHNVHTENPPSHKHTHNGHTENASHKHNGSTNHNGSTVSTPPSKNTKIDLRKTISEKAKKGSKTSKKIKEEIKSLEKEKEELSKQVFHVDEILELNVGGVVYTTTRTTLMKQKGTLLCSLSSGKYNIMRDEQGRYFIDRDGNIFRYILNFLRSGYIGDLSRKELMLLRPEAEFYSIRSLLTIIDNKLKEHFNSKFAVLRYNENSNVNHLSWQGKTEPCKLTKTLNLYKCIDEVLTEVDNRGWELLQMSGDGGAEGGWMYVFRKKPPVDHYLKLKFPYDDDHPENADSFESEDSTYERRGHEKVKSNPSPTITRIDRPEIQRQHSGSM